MTRPRTAAEVLSGHVRLEVRCIDRVMLTLRQPRLQYGQGIHNFFCQHRGNRFASSALMLPMTERFTADIRHSRHVPAGPGPVREGAEQGPGRQEYLAGHHGGECVLFVGVARRRPGCGGPRSARTRRPGSGTRGFTRSRRWPAMVFLWLRRRLRPVPY